MAKKYKLDIAYEWNGVLLAMVCPWPDYKLAWKLSKELGIELARKKDWQILFKEDKKNSYPLYQFNNEYTTFRLLKNRAYQIEYSEQALLLPELKDFDYLFLIETEAEINFDAINQRIRNIDSIQLLKSFNPETLKSKHNIAF
ncbi:IPExxxVDY family protein [Hyphobacterium sp. CCMP332]|nr:IPExxxVDY family protein [Hyphobacterium sp. CCMP332]